MTTINDSPITNDSDTELEAFEQRVNEIAFDRRTRLRAFPSPMRTAWHRYCRCSTPSRSRICSTAFEELGGSANVFVRTAEGTAILTVNEYSPEDAALDTAESEADAEADAQSAE